MNSKPTHKGTNKTYSLSTTSAAAATTTSQRPFHPIVKLGGSCGEGRRDENTEKEREGKTPKKQKKQTNQQRKQLSQINGKGGAHQKWSSSRNP
jgi:hypothetical protein